MTAPLTALSHCPVPDLNYSLGVQVDICLLELLTKLMDRKNYSKHMIVFVDIVQWILSSIHSSLHLLCQEAVSFS